MKEPEFKIEKGKVVSFDETTSRGRISLPQGEVEFHSTSFQSALPTRFPRAGEPVSVTFSRGQLVSVHSA
jgi:hypothetical protein